jgi:predicted transcriptional regulator
MDQQPELYPIELECITFFEENLYTFETLEGLALRIGRKKEDLQIVLNKLVQLAIVEKIGNSGQPFVYRYIKPVESVI